MKKHLKNYPFTLTIILSLIISLFFSLLTDVFDFGLDTLIIFIVSNLIFLITFLLKRMEEENINEYEETKYGDDPEWEEYKRLRKKFNK